MGAGCGSARKGPQVSELTAGLTTYRLKVNVTAKGSTAKASSIPHLIVCRSSSACGSGALATKRQAASAPNKPPLAVQESHQLEQIALEKTGSQVNTEPGQEHQRAWSKWHRQGRAANRSRWGLCCACAPSSSLHAFGVLQLQITQGSCIERVDVRTQNTYSIMRSQHEA